MKIAVIGAGISGLVAARELSRHHGVRVFEAGPRPGGHTRTVETEADGTPRRIDMGFIVCNDRTYPGFLQLLADLGVATRPSCMSFSVRCERTGLEYNGSSLDQLFVQRSNLWSPSFLRMVLGILRFHRTARRESGSEAAGTLRDFLERTGTRGPVVDLYLIPMLSAIWSTDPEDVLDFPLRPLLDFLENHGMLRVDGRPEWRVVEGGSDTYVDRIAAQLGERLVTNCPIDWVRRFDDRVEIRPAGGLVEVFDEVVIATHTDQALALLADPGPTEARILSAIPYRPSEVVLHTDSRFLPRRAKARASWNYHLHPPRPGGPQVTYWMNRLQGFESDVDFCVTLNRTAEIAPEKILVQETFSHPLYTRNAALAQALLPEIDGARRTHYCGAWCGHGFHEDGVESGLRVARALAARRLAA